MFFKVTLPSPAAIVAFAAMILMPVIFSFSSALAATTIPFTINMSEAVNVTGTPRIPIDVGGNPDGTARYATYASGTGTSTLTFNYAMIAGDLDLDGVTLTSPIDLNGGTMKDLNGNDANLSFTIPNTSNVKVSYPSLSMDFIANRYTSGINVYNSLASFLSPLGGTFTRASIGTYFDSAGVLQTAASGTPRFDYDPITHAAKGLLIEEQRTNSLIQATAMDNAVWTKQTLSVTADATTSPSGATDADKLVESNTLGNHHLRQVVSGSLSGTFTISIFAKAAERTNVLLYMDDGSGVSVSYNFNLSTQAITQVNLNAAWASPSTKIESVGNGWYRCSLTATRATATTFNARYAVSDGTNYNGGTGLPNYTGDGTSGLYVWGAQLESAGFSTSYIPTTTATVTRAAEVFTIPTGTWFNGTEGTAVAWTKQSPLSTATMRFLAFYKDSGNRMMFQKNSATGVRLFSQVASSTVATPTATSTFSGSYIKVAGAYKLNNYGISLDNSNAVTATGAIPSGIIQLDVGSSGTDWINTSLSQLKYYPVRVSDAQLKLLTQ